MERCRVVIDACSRTLSGHGKRRGCLKKIPAEPLQTELVISRIDFRSMNIKSFLINLSMVLNSRAGRSADAAQAVTRDAETSVTAGHDVLGHAITILGVMAWSPRLVLVHRRLKVAITERLRRWRRLAGNAKTSAKQKRAPQGRRKSGAQCYILSKNLRKSKQSTRTRSKRKRSTVRARDQRAA